MKVTAIDFETANGNPASVCAVGISVLEDGVAEETYYSLIKPESNVSYFSKMNIAIHGIYPTDVIDAPTFQQVYKEIQPLLENSIVTAHNAPFDMKCLRETCINTGIRIPDLIYFDTVDLSRKVFPHLPHHRLNDMCEYLNVELNHHNALSDSYGCLMIVASVMNLTGEFEIVDMLSACNVRTHRL